MSTLIGAAVILFIFYIIGQLFLGGQQFYSGSNQPYPDRRDEAQAMSFHRSHNMSHFDNLLEEE